MNHWQQEPDWRFKVKWFTYGFISGLTFFSWFFLYGFTLIGKILYGY